MTKVTKEAALRYHNEGRPGKIEIKPTKPYSTQSDLSLAYSPGVAYPCLEYNKILTMFFNTPIKVTSLPLFLMVLQFWA